MKTSTKSVSIGIAVALLAGLTWFINENQASPEEVVPAQVVEVGFKFDMPCEEHGKHVIEVTGTELVRTYTLRRDDGAEGVFGQEDLVGWLAELGVKTGEKSGQ